MLAGVYEYILYSINIYSCRDFNTDIRMPNYHLADWSCLLIHKFGIARQAALQVFISPGITYRKPGLEQRRLLWLKGELSLWGLFANIAGTGASGHGLWHFLRRDGCLSNGKRGETVHMLQRHTPLGLAEIRYGCNTSVTNPFDAGGMGCGFLHIL